MADMDLKDAINLISDICGDSVTPKNIREKMSNVIKILEGDEEDSIKINKALNELDEIVNDSNMQQFTRTEIWNIVSFLESKK